MKLQKGSKLVCMGDSVTDCGRNRPVAEGLFDPLGKGYVNIINGFLTAACPELAIRVVNMGCSGDTVRNLKSRWQTDVFDLNPDWVSIMIGVNDVWRQYDMPLITEQHVYLDEYAQTLEELIRQTLPKVKGLILMTPYYMEPNKKDAMRATMDKYGAVVKKLAKKYGTIFVDTQAAFDEVLRHMHPNAIAWDRIHPNIPGHTVLARAFLDAIDFQW